MDDESGEFMVCIGRLESKMERPALGCQRKAQSHNAFTPVPSMADQKSVSERLKGPATVINL